jgi:hypothetical protein
MTTETVQDIFVTPKQAEELILTYWNANIVPFLWGSPGIGKSSIIRQIAEDLGYSVCDVRALLYDPVDIRGIPVPNHDTGVVVWFVPDFLPKEGEKVVMLLDEMNAATQAVQASLYQLMLDRKLGDYTLPETALLIAAGNFETDRAVTHRMPTPLANRLGHINLMADVKDLVEWGLLENEEGVPNLRDEVRGFLRFRENEGSSVIHNMEVPGKAFPSPRTWEFVSRFMDEEPDEKIEHPGIAGIIGPGTASEFLAYCKDHRRMPDLDALIVDPDAYDIPNEASIHWAITTGVGRRANSKNFTNCMKVIEKMNVPELMVVMIRDAVSVAPEVLHTKAYVKWAEDNYDLMSD